MTNWEIQGSPDDSSAQKQYIDQQLDCSTALSARGTRWNRDSRGSLKSVRNPAPEEAKRHLG